MEQSAKSWEISGTGICPDHLFLRRQQYHESRKSSRENDVKGLNHSARGRVPEGKRCMEFYGDEQSGMPPESLYISDDALEALSKTNEVLIECQKLIETKKGAN
jgi:hypothetical protein